MLFLFCTVFNLFVIKIPRNFFMGAKYFCDPYCKDRSLLDMRYDCFNPCCQLKDYFLQALGDFNFFKPLRQIIPRIFSTFSLNSGLKLNQYPLTYAALQLKIQSMILCKGFMSYEKKTIKSTTKQ